MHELKQKQLNAYQSAIKKEQDDVVIAYMPAVRAMAYRLKERLPSSVDVSDLIGCGVEEMIKLARRYDKEQNDSFWGFAHKRVYGAMLDFLRSLDIMSRANRTLIKSINQEIDIYFNEFEEEPDDEYLAKKLGENIEKIHEARSVGSIISVLPLDDQMGLYSGEDTQDMIEKQDLIEKIEEILNTFGKRDQLMIQLYYYEELSLKEISEIMSVSESRVSQIHKRLLGKLRDKLGA